MYNGIGLPTARGSGTNGYVQRNLAHVSKKRQMRPDIVSQPDPNINKGRNIELVLHQKKREIESKCLRLRMELEDEGWKHSDIENEIDAYRKRKLRELEAEFPKEEPKPEPEHDPEPEPKREPKKEPKAETKVETKQEDKKRDSKR